MIINETELALQLKSLMDQLWNIGVVLFLIILFKDTLSSLANNLLAYIKMRIDKKTYSAEGGVVMIGKEPYVIINISFGYIILKSLNGDNSKIRMRISDYWNSVIKYKDVENLEKDFLKHHDGFKEI